MSLLKNLLKRRPAEKLFHYTSQAGLIGIVTTKSIWATSLHHLNDAAEFSYGYQIARNIIAEKPLEGINGELSRELIKALENSAKINIFVACFSEKPDLLSQWRAYCPNGNGYSIGFDYKQIDGQISEQDFFLAPCVYDPAEQVELVRELIDTAYSELTKSTAPILSNISYECLSNFYSLAPALKHPSFAEEAEWRLVSKFPKMIYDLRISVREGQSMMLPYFKLELALENAPMPDVEVVVGPNPHIDLAVRSVHFLFHNFGVKVRPTAIPFRGW